MEWLQRLLDSTSIPVFSAFLLGLMAAISPCPLATNITAVGFLSRDISRKNLVFYNGLIYTTGRALSYTVIGLILFLGGSKFHIARLFTGYGEKLLGPFLLIIGILMLGIIKINLPVINRIINKLSEKPAKNNYLSAFLLGVIFALAFCPYSGVLFFGMLIPLAIASTSGLYLPLVFAIATGLPVIFFSFILSFSVYSLAGLYNKIQLFQKWFNRFVALIFIATGTYFIIIYYFHL